MKKNFVYFGIVLPVVSAVIVGFILFNAVYMNADKLSPLPQEIPLAYHDTLKPDKTADGTDALFEKNEIIGTIRSSDDIQLRYDADYSNLIDSASLNKKSTEIGSTGCLYIYAGIQNIAKISTDSPLTLEAGGKEYSYVYSEEKLVGSENEALSIAPEAEKSMVIYYRVSNGIGLTPDYYALIFKEVA